MLKLENVPIYGVHRPARSANECPCWHRAVFCDIWILFVLVWDKTKLGLTCHNQINNSSFKTDADGFVDPSEEEGNIDEYEYEDYDDDFDKFLKDQVDECKVQNTGADVTRT